MVFTSFQNSWNSHPCPHQLVFRLLQHAFFRPWGAQSTCSPPWQHGCKVHFSSSLQRHNTHGVSICQLLFFWNSSLKLFIFISQDPKDYSQLTYYGEVSPHYCSALLRSTSTIHLQDFKMHGTVPPLASSVVALPASLKLLKTVLCHESWRELHWLCNCSSYPPWSKKKKNWLPPENAASALSTLSHQPQHTVVTGSWPTICILKLQKPGDAGVKSLLRFSAEQSPSCQVSCSFTSSFPNFTPSLLLPLFHLLSFLFLLHGYHYTHLQPSPHTRNSSLTPASPVLNPSGGRAALQQPQL